MTQLIHTASGATFTSEEQARKHYSGVSAEANNGYGITLDPADPELLAKLLAVGYAEYVPPPVVPYIPTITESKASVKAVRDNMLRSYSDKLVIYQPNYDAAVAILAGNGDTHLVPSGVTANQFATANAAAMGLPDAAYWANYIDGEWRRLGVVVDAMEREYLRLTYHPTTGLSAMTDVVDAMGAVVTTAAEVAAAVAAEYVATYGQ